MFEPIRGGTRGGQAEFKWSDVSADKDRENYLGHSVNAPTGRWQKNKDIHWYNRDSKGSAEERAEEIRKVKEAEAEALSVALGFGPSKKEPQSSDQGTGTNAIPIPAPPTAGVDVNPEAAAKAAERAERAERKLRRAERREEKAARRAEKAAHKAQRRAHDGRYRDDSPSPSRTPVRRLRDSRSHSPKRYRSHDTADREDDRYQRSRDHHHSPDGSRFRDRSRSPHCRESERHSQRRSYQPLHGDRYNDTERERELAKDRQRWDHNSRRQTPGGGQWGRK